MDYNLVEMCLLGLLAFIGLSVLVSLIIYYRNYFKAKKKLEIGIYCRTGYYGKYEK